MPHVPGALTPVVFRVDMGGRSWRCGGREKREAGACLALFPEERQGYQCLMYSHNARFNYVNYNVTIDYSRAAFGNEAAGLQAELEAMGYRLKVKRRRA